MLEDESKILDPQWIIIELGKLSKK
jgi:hypothetical protein